MELDSIPGWEVPKVWDLKFFKPELKQANSVLLCFGSKATKEAEKNFPGYHLVSIGDLNEVSGAGYDKKKRQEAFEKLTSLHLLLCAKVADYTEERGELTLSELPSVISAQELPLLEKALKTRGVEYWLGHLKDGRTIAVGLNEIPLAGAQQANIYMSFRELTTLLSFTSLLGIKEVELVKGSQPNSIANTESNASLNSSEESSSSL